MKRAALALLALTASAAPRLSQSPQHPTFTAGVTVVLVDALVTDGNKPIGGLTAADFRVKDDGVPQALTEVRVGTMPIDVRLVFDMSGSLSDAQVRQHARAMSELIAALAPQDRCEVLEFRRRVREAAPLQAPPFELTVAREGVEGTSFYDALSLAMITVPRPGRRQLTIALTDGHDSTSFFDWTMLRYAAERTDAVVSVVEAVDPASSLLAPVPAAVAAHPPPSPLGWKLRLRGYPALQGLTEITGGQVFLFPTNGDLAVALTRALFLFRQSYVLAYTPTGVAPTGWHALTVSVVDHGRPTVRVKQGYDAGPPGK